MHSVEALTQVDFVLKRSGGAELLTTLDEASRATSRHSRRVGGLAVCLGSELPGLPDAVIVSLGFSARLHDVGKAHPSIRDLVNSPEKLLDKDSTKVRRVHTEEGAKMIAALIPGNASFQHELTHAAYTAGHHHDDLPDPQPGPAAGDIRSMVEIAALVRVIDAFDTVQGIGRPYITDPARTPQEAVERVTSSGITVHSFFDISPEVVLDTLVQVAR